MPLSPEQVNIALQGLVKWFQRQGTAIKPGEVEGFKRAIQSNPQLYEHLGKSAAGGAAAGAGATPLLPLLGAGALTTAAWAYPAKKLGEEIGWRIEEKKAGKRLRPVEPSFKQYAKYIPGAIASTVTAPARWVGKGAKIVGQGVLSAIKRKLKKK